MKSFDEWFSGYENLQCDKDACEDAFEAGQQFKQAEIDELKREMLNKTNEAYADGQKSMRKMIKSNEDKLQKRIDEALKELEHIHFYKTQNSNNAIKILKGDTIDY